MNIILFGPPGIGKSTIIGYLKTKGFAALDLEDIYPLEVRHELPKQLDNHVFGGADLDPAKDYGANVKKYLLTAQNQEEYSSRRNSRDRKFPGKASQSQHLLEDWMTGVFDKVVVTKTAVGPERTATRLAGHLVSKYPSLLGRGEG